MELNVGRITVNEAPVVCGTALLRNSLTKTDLLVYEYKFINGLKE